MPSLELACFTPSSALLGIRAGVHRIELCTSYSTGGLTPPLSSLQSVLSARHKICNSSSSSTTSSHAPPFSTPPVYAMIRPTPNPSFTASAADFQHMASSILLFKEAGADGFVFGILSEQRAGEGEAGGEKRVDVARNAALVALASPKPCTFHRAFDEIGPRWQTRPAALQAIAECGFKGLLTSGGGTGGGAAEEGGGERLQFEDLKELTGLAASYGVELILGGGVRAGNIAQLREAVGSGVCWFHSSAIVRGSGGGDEEASEEEVRRLLEAVAVGE